MTDSSEIRPSDYQNTRVVVPGRVQDAVNMACDRLMPPQYDEFIKAISGGNVSDATRRYWEDVYQTFVELAGGDHD